MSKRQQYQQKLLEKREIVLMNLQMELDVFFSDEKTAKLLKMGKTKFYQEVQKMKARAKK